MKQLLACLAFVTIAFVTLGSDAAQPPAQERWATERPGQPTRAAVHIENRGPAEAMPVIVHDIVHATPFRVRHSRQLWEYRTVTLAPGDDPAKILAPFGLEGWEATGLQVTDGTRTRVVLKRPSDN
jgi:hypothetical protein